jgi:predicted transcriptional regulator
MSQFDRLTPGFRDSLRGVADSIRVAQSVPSPEPAETKETAIANVMVKIQKFQERAVKEWLYSLSDEEAQEVGRFFDEINGLSVVDVFAIMKEQGCCSPFDIVAHMFTSEGRGNGGVEVVTIDDPSADNAKGIPPTGGQIG